MSEAQRQPADKNAAAIILVLMACVVLSACSSRTHRPDTVASPPNDRVKLSPVVMQDRAPKPSKENDRADQLATAAKANVDEQGSLVMIPPEAPLIDQAPGTRQLCLKPNEENIGVVNEVQIVFEETTCTAALWLDGLFGSERNLESARETSGYLETSTSYSEFEGSNARIRFRARIRLPNLKDRFSAVIGRDNEDDVARDRTERFAVRAQLPQFEDNDEWLAGLGYSFPGSEKLKLDSRVGASNLTDPRLYLQQRLRYIAYSDEQRLILMRGTAFWTNRTGFGVTGGADITRVLSEKFLLRLSYVGTISEETEGLDWFNGMIFYQHLTGQRALAYEILVRGQTDEPEPLYEYGVRTVYRHPILRDRLYAEFLVGYSWPRIDPALKREGSARVGLSLEVPFGQSDKTPYLR